MKHSHLGPASTAGLGLAVLALLLSALTAPATAGGGKRSPIEVAGIDLVVKLKDPSRYSAQDLAGDFPVELKGALLRSRGIFVFSPTDARTAHDEDRAERLAEDITHSSNVRYAEPDFAATLADNRYHSWPEGTPEDAGDAPGPFQEQPLTRRLQLDEVRALSTGAGTTVAVLDTGVQLDHPALAGRLGAGYDYVDDDSDPTDVRQGLDANENGVVDEAFGHGTFVAGMVSLVAPDTRILPMRVLDSDGTGSIFLVSQAIIDATDDGADVINISLGTPEKLKSKVVKEVLEYADDHGVVVVAAAGNAASDDQQYPADNKHVLSVTSSELDEDAISDFANWGRWVDVAAPAAHVLGPVPGGGYAWWAGTSMAAPQVSAQVALLTSAGGTTSKDLDAVSETARKIVKRAGRKVKHGRIDVLGSIRYLQARQARAARK